MFSPLTRIYSSDTVYRVGVVEGGKCECAYFPTHPPCVYVDISWVEFISSLTQPGARRGYEPSVGNKSYTSSYVNRKVPKKVLVESSFGDGNPWSPYKVVENFMIASKVCKLVQKVHNFHQNSSIAFTSYASCI